MRRPIEDKFKKATTATGKPASRQQRHLLRRRAEGLCAKCDNARAVYIVKYSGEIKESTLCDWHRYEQRERMRARLGCVRRYAGRTESAARQQLKQLRSA